MWCRDKAEIGESNDTSGPCCSSAAELTESCRRADLKMHSQAHDGPCLKEELFLVPSLLLQARRQAFSSYAKQRPPWLGLKERPFCCRPP